MWVAEYRAGRVADFHLVSVWSAASGTELIDAPPASLRGCSRKASRRGYENAPQSEKYSRIWIEIFLDKESARQYKEQSLSLCSASRAQKFLKASAGELEILPSLRV